MKERKGTEQSCREASPVQQLLFPFLGVSFSLKVWEVSSLLLASHIHCQSSSNLPPPPPLAPPPTHFYPQQLLSLLQFPGRDLLLVVQMSQVYGLEVLSRGCSLICNQLATGQMGMVVQWTGHPTCCHHCPDLTTNSDA